MGSEFVQNNFDLLAVGIAIAGIALLGFMVYFNNKRSITNRTFFVFAFWNVIWGISNYLEYRFTTEGATLWALRFHLFLSTWYAFLFFRLAYVFPDERRTFPRWYRIAFVPLVVATSILTLTPYVFSGLESTIQVGQVTRAAPGPGMALFVLVAFGALVLGIGILFKRIWKVSGVQRIQSLVLFIGMTLTACLILVFNVVLPNMFDNLSFIPLAALFLLPFVAFTAYAIRVHRLFDVKVFSSAVLVFLLAIFTFAEIVFADSLSLIIFRSGIFALVLIFGVNLLRGVFHEVDQRERIQKLAQELEMYNEQLSEFMSLATHEIRNPATFIKGYTASALEGDLGELTPELKDGMQKLYIRANDIIHLGNQYLNKSKIELHQLKYEFVKTDMKVLVGDLAREFMPASEQEGLTIEVKMDEGKDYTIDADTGKIKEVVANLIDNAVKYTEQGTITVGLTRDDAHVHVSVTDTGVGIAEDVIPKLFQKFSRADAEKANILGTGLGLYLAKIFVEAHHGAITVHSEGKNKGSTFTLELPVAQAHA